MKYYLDYIELLQGEVGLLRGSVDDILEDASDLTVVSTDAGTTTPVNYFFVDSTDDVLKFKDAQGIVHVVSLVP